MMICLAKTKTDEEITHTASALKVQGKDLILARRPPFSHDSPCWSLVCITQDLLEPWKTSTCKELPSECLKKLLALAVGSPHIFLFLVEPGCNGSSQEAYRVAGIPESWVCGSHRNASHARTKALPKI